MLSAGHKPLYITVCKDQAGVFIELQGQDRRQLGAMN